MDDEAFSADIQQIIAVLPHRYPMLLIDRVLELVPQKRARGYKNITANEPYFTGHFPENPLLPGVFMIEAMAQLGGMIVLKPVDFLRRSAYLVGIDKAKFRRPVIPGDCLMMEAEVIRVRSGIGWVRGLARVDDKIACEANLMYSVGDIKAARFEATVLGAE